MTKFIISVYAIISSTTVTANCNNMKMNNAYQSREEAMTQLNEAYGICTHEQLKASPNEAYEVCNHT